MIEAILTNIAREVIFYVIGLIVSAIAAWWGLRQFQKKIAKAKEAEQKLKEANQIADDEERMRKKAEAACELERALNPDAEC